MTLPSSSLGYAARQFDGLSVENDFHFDEAEGSYSGPEAVNEFITPIFEQGDVWALKLRLTVDTEPSDGPVFFELMDESESTFIQRAVIPAFDGHNAEINVIVDWQTAEWNTGAGSPDLRVAPGETDSSSYHVSCVGIRVRSADNQNSMGSPEKDTQWGFDA